MTILGACLPQGRSGDFTAAQHLIAGIHQNTTTERNLQAGFVVSGRDVATHEGNVLALQGRPLWDGRLIGASDLLHELLSCRFECLNRLRGNYAVVGYRADTNSVVLAIDRMGIERLTYSVSPAGICFGTRAIDVRRIPGFESDVANQSIYDFLFFHMVPSPYTIFDKVSKLPPAHFLEWTDGRDACARSWEPDFQSSLGSTTIPELEGELHATLETATRQLDPDDASGAFLSGGLDSSTVAGYLSRVLQKPVHTFSIGFDVDSYDELKYARAAAGHFKCVSHEYKVSAEDVVDLFGRIVAAYDEPFGNSSVIPTYYCAKAASELGIGRMFAGDGGDELFGGNERYARHKLLEAYSSIPQSIRKGIIEPAAFRVAPDSRLAPLRKLRRYIEQAIVPMPERLGTNFAFSSGLQNALSSDFRDAVDPGRPLAHMNDVFMATEADSLLDRQLAYDWRMTLADNDLRKVGTMCELAGIDVAYPMLNDDLIDFSLEIPAFIKLKRLELRSFYRKAMQGFLPDPVLKKSKHGFGLPFGIWLKNHAPLAELIYSNLSDLKTRCIFKPDFIDDLISQHRTGPAAFYGYFIWDLAVLEEWMKRYGSRGLEIAA